MPSFFLSAKHKIALFFSFLSSGLIILMTLLTIFLVKSEINLQAKNTLEKALKTVIKDYQSNSLQEKTSTLQSRNVSSEYSTGLQIAPRALPNIKNKNVIVPNNIIGNELNKFDLTGLQNNREVYSRVVLANGGILFSSDLFDVYNIDTQISGFYTIDKDSLCVNILTSKIVSGNQNGTIVQVGQYCPFSSTQQKDLFYKIILVTLFLLAITYIVGFKMAEHFLKPLEKSIRQTKQFAENCYHELMTPLSVAITTIAATKRTEKYKEGIESLEEDLKDAYYSLQAMNNTTLLKQFRQKHETIHISRLIEEIIKTEQISRVIKDRNLMFNLNNVENNVQIKADETSAKIIFQNIIINAIKYAKESTEIIVTLNKNKLTVENEILPNDKLVVANFFQRGYRGENTKLIQGRGLGLAIVKDLSEMHKWNAKAYIDRNKVNIEIAFL